MRKKPSELRERVLIRNKLHRAGVPCRVVDRSRLLERLDAGLDRRLTVISAGPGFGKTTLVAQWLAQSPFRSAWLSLDRLDREPERYARYFVEALRELLPGGLERTAAHFRAGTPPPWSYFTEVLASELTPPEERSILVLDDYHIVASEQVDDLTERVVEVLPEGLHLVVVTRMDPAWPSGRWRARGWVNELRSRDLRFNLEETRAFFGVRAERPLEDEIIGILHQKTEGWVAGLRLAELSMAGSDRPEERARRLTGADRNIVDFLVRDVLADQPPEVREFLAVAATFDEFCAPLCDHVLGLDRSPGAQEILERLEARNLFLVPLDAERNWYRFHHLFREFLVQELGDLVPSSARPRAQTRAAVWYSEHGMVEEALRHWVAAGELDSAAALVGGQVDTVARTDLSRKLLSRWLRTFPPGAEHGRLPLLVAHGCQRIIRWDLSGLGELLEEADRLSSAADGSFRSNLGALRAFLCYWTGDGEGALRSARIALSDRPAVGGLTWTLATMYSAAAGALFGRRAEALQLLDEAVVEGARHGHVLPEFIAMRGILHLFAQEHDAVEGSSRQLLAAHDRTPVPEYWLGHGYYLLGTSAYERNRLQEAEDWFRRVAALRYLVTSRLYQDGLIGLALIAHARGDERATQTHVADARAWALEVGDPTLLRMVTSLETRLSIAGSRLPADTNDPPPADDHVSFWLEVPTVTWAERLIADPSPACRKQALPFIEAALERMRRHHNTRQTTVLSVLRVTALDADGRRDDALEGLAEVLARAEPERLVRTFLDRGLRLKVLLDALSSAGGQGRYCEMLRGAFLEATRSNRRTGGADDEPWNLVTFRELEVLELLAERLTDKEIAARLSVTAGAIKKRTRNIYRKLDAGDRREAVARALARGILTNER